MGEFIALVSFAVFVWAVVGLINPKAASPHRSPMRTLKGRPVW